jgi:lipopolysaccharide export system ATP-binding protein
MSEETVKENVSEEVKETAKEPMEENVEGLSEIPSEVVELKAINLSKAYKNKVVVKSVSMTIQAGEVVGLLGPNGAGKTTSFYMALGLVAVDKGQVFYKGEEITSLSMAQRAKLGISYLPQEPSIFRTMTVEENIMVALEAAGVLKADLKRKAKKLYQEFQIEHIVDSLGKSLSGGERRRVEIARALAGGPDFLLLDEPFAGIDPIAVSEIQKIILSLKNNGLGILITDHNVRETLGICDRAYLLKSGEVVLNGSPDDILNSKVARESYLGEDFKM